MNENNWTLLKNAKVGDRVFCQHFMGHSEFDGSKGHWATVTSRRDAYNADNVGMISGRGVEFFENCESYVGIES